MELVGSRFGHIRIVDVLGEGGMGSVYSGFDETLHRRVAVKALHRERRLDAVARARLMREARSLSQLDHPNICRIYDYIEGEEVDLLVLELIEGKTLQKALADGLPRAEKIRIACDIAKVLEVAHRRGIVHRDLKPDNVMLTEKGEVKVLDFGLARWLDQPAAAPVLHTVPEDDEFGWAFLEAQETDSGRRTAILDHGVEHTQNLAATAAGITLGTPLYMSPEQARGEHMTPASDMYSFGMLLQTLFTEHEPYPMDVLGSEVMRRAARGDSLPMTGERTITALVNRLKQLAPTDRITAHETVARLGWIADAPKRMVRRTIAALVVLAIALSAWKYTFDLQRERAAAVAAQHEAEHRRAQADDLIGFMLGDLRKKLEPEGKLDLLDGAATHALAYLSDLDQKSMNTPELVRAAKALNQLGEVRSGQGNLNAAASAFASALKFADSAAKRSPNDIEARLIVGTTHFYIADAFLRRREFAHALPEFQLYRDVTRRLALAHPGNFDLAIERAYGESNVGTALEDLGNLQGALDSYKAAMAIEEGELLRHPGNLDLQTELARQNNKIGVIQQKLGELAAARSHFENEVATYESVLRVKPSQNMWRQRLSTAHDFLAGVLEDLGDPAAALEHRRTEVAMDEQLCTIDPTNAGWQRNRAVANAKLALLLRDGYPAAAVAAIRTAQATMTAVLNKDPTRQLWLGDLAAIDQRAAIVFLDAGDRAAAKAAAEEAVAICRRLGGTDPDARYRFAEALIVRGDVAAKDGDAATAREQWYQAADQLRPLIAATADPAVHAAWARVLVRLKMRSEAEPVLAHLAAIGYRNSEIGSLIQRNDGS